MGIILILSGCSSNSAPQDSSGTEQGSSDMTQITDAFERKVEIPKDVKTVAAIGGAARIMTYAGCAQMLVGVTDVDKKNITAMPYASVNAERFAKLTSVGSGGSNDTPYLEEIIKLAPDLIIAMPGNVEVVNNVAAKTGIPVLGINATAMFDESFYEALELIGEALGTQEQSAKVIKYVQGCQKDLNDRTKDISDDAKPKVYTGAVSFKGAHGFEGTYGEYPPFTAINAKNVADETGQAGSYMIDLEKITVWDPDIIFLNPVNMSLVNEDYDKNPVFYDSLRAVKAGDVYTQPSFNYNWTNIEIAIADAYYAGKIIFPEQFADIDPVEKADEIFTVMLGEPFYEKLAADGIRFEKIKIGE